MASKQNQGVLVSLIVFIVLTLAFGVATYFGAKGYKEQKALLATALSERAGAVAERDKVKAELDVFKAKLGYGAGSADVIIDGKDGSEEIEDKPVHYNGMSDDLAVALGESGRALTFKDGVAKLTAGIADVNGKIAAKVQSRDASVQNAFQQIANSEKNLDAFGQNVEKMATGLKTQLDDATAKYADLTKQFNEQTKEFDTQKRNAKAAIDIANAETEKERKAADNFADINLDLARRIDLLTNNDFETADATVVSTDQVGKFVRLDVGSADGIRPLVKFNVFPKEALEKGGVKAKASVQVTHSLEDHVCEAKILEDDPNNPIEPGDVVFTPLWQVGAVNKYALDYRLDIDGDGVSDLGEIYNAITIAGGEVVAYIDDDGNIHGKITPDVFRYVVADSSVLSRIADAGDVSEVDRARIEEDCASFKESAKNNGVRELRLPDLLVQIGYKKTEALGRDKVAKTAGQRLNAESKNEVDGVSVVPIYQSQDANKPGAVLPIYEEGAEKEAAPKPTFRKRTPKK